MYKKVYGERMDSKYWEEMNSLQTIERKSQIKKPKIKYYRVTKLVKGIERLLIIDENGMNFLKDNYPIDSWGMEEVKDKKIVIKNYLWSENNPKSYYVGKLKDGTNYGENRKKFDKEKGVIRYYVKNNWVLNNEKVEVVLKDYKEYHYDSKGRLLMEENYGDKFLMFDKWGNSCYWNNQKQRLFHTKHFLGSSGSMYHTSKRLRMTKEGTKEFFNHFYWKWVDKTFMGRR